MAKKRKLKAENSLERSAQVQASLVAQNSLMDAMRLSDWDLCGHSSSLSNGNAYNNIKQSLLSLQQYLLTYLYKTYGVLGKIVDVPVDDAYKNGGFDVASDTLDEDELEELKRKLRRAKDIEVIKTARRWARLFGGAAIICYDGHDLDTPLNMKKLISGAVELVAVDRWQLTYSEPNVDMKNGKWYLSNYQTMENGQGTEIHPSRVKIVKGKRAPFLIQQQVQNWGISVYEQIFQDMSQFFKGRNVLFELLDEAKTDVLKLSTLQTALMSADGERTLQRMVDFIAKNKNYKSQITISSDDDYQQKQVSLGGVADILKEIRVMMSGSANIPVSKLWGEGVTGFGSGEDSLENYNSMIESEVRTEDEDVIDWVLKIRCNELFGRELPDLIIEWKKLRVMSSIDEQNIKDHELSNALQLFDRRLLTPQEFMELLKKKSILIQDTKAIRGELEDMPLANMSKQTEQEDIAKE